MSPARPGPKRKAGEETAPLRHTLKISRDQLVLRWVCEQYAARLDHIEALTQRTHGIARPLVKRLREEGLVTTRLVLVGEPLWVIPTRRGLNAAGMAFPLSPPQGMQLEHIAAMNAVRLHVQTRSPDVRWIPERTLSQQRRPGRRNVHIPDGVAVVNGREVAIEVELYAKPWRLVSAKLDVLATCFDAIVYFCTPTPMSLMNRLQATGRWPTLEVYRVPNWEGRA